MGKKKQLRRDQPVTKEDLLMAVDSAIGSLITLRTLIDLVIKQAEAPPAPEPGSAEHAGHDVVAQGFGAPLYCMDCELDVGVSPKPADDPRP